MMEKVKLILVCFMLSICLAGDVFAKGNVIDTGASGYFPSIDGNIIAFHTLEIKEGKDLNGDGDLLDRIIRYHDISSGFSHFTGVVGIYPIVSGDLIIFSQSFVQTVVRCFRILKL